MESTTYNTFALRIDKDNNIESKWATRDSEDVVQDERISETKSLRDDITDGIARLRQGETREDDIQRLGRNLYLALFPERVGESFRRAINQTLNDSRKDKSSCLRVILDIHPKSDGFGWPLEFLYCDYQGGYWLATEKPWITLSRRTTFGGTINLERQSWPLRVLAIVSKPKGLKGVLSSKVLGEIGKLAETNSSGAPARKMEIKVLGQLDDYEKDIPGIEYLNRAATWGNIREITSSAWQPQVVHFIGHGKLDAEKDKGCIGLIKAEFDNAVDWCDADRTTKLFSVPPRLVVLQACESAAPGTERGYMSLATQLLQRNILAVIAMQFEIRNDDAIDFAVSFYEALRDGLDVDAAVQSGRWKISTQSQGWSQRYFGGPVLYMYQPFAIIQRAPRPKSRLPSPQQRPAALNQNRLSTLDQAKVMLDDATSSLERDDRELAKISIKGAIKKLSSVGLERVIPSLETAFKWLGEVDDVESAREVVLQAKRMLSILPTVESARADIQAPGIEPSITYEGLPTEANLPSSESTAASASRESGWTSEAESLSRDRIKKSS